MRANQARSRIATIARVLGVSPSGFHAWRAREPSRRQQGDEALKARIGPIHPRSRGTCGRLASTPSSPPMESGSGASARLD